MLGRVFFMLRSYGIQAGDNNDLGLELQCIIFEFHPINPLARMISFLGLVLSRFSPNWIRPRQLNPKGTA
jgi:hypothetical protein